MAERVNQEIVDAFTARQILAGRVETQERQEVWALLVLLETDLLHVLKTEDPFAIEQLARRRRAVEAMVQESLEPLITARYAQIAAQVDAVLVRLAQAEARATQQLVNDATGEATVEDVPPGGLVRVAVTQTLFPSPTTPTDLATFGSDWWTRQGAGLTQRLGDQLLVSAALGETVTQATAKLQGTRAAGFQDGLMAKAREDATRLLRTQTTNALGEAHAAVGKVNPGQGLVLLHSSVLDSRTCLQGETLVQTSKGSMPIQDIKVGDIVLGGSGQPRQVLAIHRKPTRQLARITFSDGTRVLCTPDHQFLTRDFGWVETQKLQENTVLRTDTML